MKTVEWIIDRCDHNGTRYVIHGPDKIPIGVVQDHGSSIFSFEAVGPILDASGTRAGGTVEEAKADVLTTLQDFGWTIQTAADAPVQAPPPGE